GITVIVADVTPAYTNSQSGRGTFSHRTRRIDRFWRGLIYDRKDDVVTVIDHVISTDASFPKRWLLHSLSQPNPTTGGFIIEPRTAHSPKHSADRLQSQVLLPRHASVVAIGGSGAEFLVEDVNYDE